MAKQASLFSEADLPPNLAKWELAARDDLLIAEVVFNKPVWKTFHYLVPPALRELITVGQRVEAPFGNLRRDSRGFCVGLSTTSPTTRQLKSLTAIVDRDPLLTSSMLELTRWIAERYLCGWGQVLDCVVPAGVKSQAGTREIVRYRLAEKWAELPAGKKLSAKQQAIVAALQQADGSLTVQELEAGAACGTGPIKTLRDKKILIPERRREMGHLQEWGAIEPHTPIVMNPDQTRVVNAIVDSLRKSEFRTFLLHGVTGSGKTEVYIKAIEEAVSFGRQAIVLVPEISLTPQTIRRFRSRFPQIAVLHSHLTDSERHYFWQQIAQGEVQVVVGARSAIFAPTPNLGLIVIDEEHETSFKQDSMPRYHAREVARKRAEMERIPLILGSATPTLESWQRVLDRQDTLLSLPKRVNNLPLPPVLTVDVRNDPFLQQGGAIGRQLFQAMRYALEAGGQVILFLNVRGFAPVLWCRACGHGVHCPHCDITLTWHKERKVALCHSCDFSCPPPTACLHCGKPGLRYLGVGTERLEAEVKARFPDFKALRMDSDTMQQRGSHDAALESFRHGQVRILLGTQMIAKGLDFPNVTLVGVVDADTCLHQPDLRASERTFQLIAQVAGRTGRGKQGGRVLVQTSCPDQPAILHAARHDFLGFAKEELEHRRLAAVPPFAHLVRIIVRGEVEADVAAFTQTIADRLKQQIARATPAPLPVKVLGPAPCLVLRLRAMFRYHLQLTAVELPLLRELWQAVQSELPQTDRVEYTIDVDPLNLR